MKHAASAVPFHLKVDFSREADGRWIADIPALPGVTVYGKTRRQALASVQALALRVIADRLEHDEAVPGDVTVSFAA
jgi:predicted RNase H-like HicB family nuclease